MNSIFIHSARQLLTLRGGSSPRRGAALSELHVITDGALLIEDGIIREVGPTRRIENLAAARKARDICVAGRVVMPGFVDSHTHLISGPSPKSDGVRSLRISPKDATMAFANTRFVRDTTARRLNADATGVLQEFLAHGTTTLEAKSGYGLDANSELKMLRILTALGDSAMTIVPTFTLGVPPPEFQRRPDEYVRSVCEDLLPRVQKRGFARFVDAIRDRGAFSADELRPFYDTARSLGLGLKLQLGQFSPPESGARLACEYPFVSLDHLDHTSDPDIEQIAESASIATLAPASSFFLGQPYAPARALIDRGAAVALATNYCRITSPTLTMQLVIFLACHELGMSPAEAISAATINGAHALRLGHRVGSLELGKQADLLMLSAGDYREIAYEFGANLVELTMKQGAVVYHRSGVPWLAAS